MTNTPIPQPRSLGQAEQAVMDYVWSHGPVSAEACRDALRERWPMKESTMRTVLRRLEAKGYVTHETRGRTFIYAAAHSSASIAARAVKNIIDRFCGGSAEALVLGMVDHAVLSPRQLQKLTEKIAQQKKGRSS